jgi:hypothetical protein
MLLYPSMESYPASYVLNPAVIAKNDIFHYQEVKMIEKNKFAKYVLIVSFLVALIAGLYFGYDYLKEKSVLTPVPGEPTSYKLTHTQEDAEYILICVCKPMKCTKVKVN